MVYSCQFSLPPLSVLLALLRVAEVIFMNQCTNIFRWLIRDRIIPGHILIGPIFNTVAGQPLPVIHPVTADPAIAVIDQYLFFLQ